MIVHYSSLFSFVFKRLNKLKSGYSIRELENLTGIKAHTIRIWEKRHGMFQPKRTDTNIRYYSNEDLKKILKIAALLQQGLKVSAITQLSNDELDEYMLQQMHQEEETDHSIEAARKSLLTALTDFDEETFNKAFSLVLLRHGLTETIIKVIYPVLENIGILWSTGAVMPAQEHFISALVRQKILSATDTLIHKTNSNEKWILFLPDGELHELGLLLANYIIRSTGRKTIYLGQSVPVENVIKVAMVTEATHIYMFAVSVKDKLEIKKQIQELNKELPSIKTFISGNPTLIQSLKLPSTMQHLQDVSSLNEILTTNTVQQNQKLIKQK